MAFKSGGFILLPRCPNLLYVVAASPNRDVALLNADEAERDEDEAVDDEVGRGSTESSFKVCASSAIGTRDAPMTMAGALSY